MEKTLEMRVEELERMLFLTKNVLSFDEASTFLNLSKSYLYKLTSGNLIPHYKPQGKMLYFEKSELEAWLRGRCFILRSPNWKHGSAKIR